jgi:superfamily II DNA or RNA helicase
MLQLDALGRQVSLKIRDRGRKYFTDNTVKILYADDEFVSAQVTGSREYTIDLERFEQELIYSCDCPYFEEHFDVCKHVWATILELEKSGHLQQWKELFPRNLVPACTDDERPDANHMYRFDEKPGFVDRSITDAARSISARSISSCNNWKEVLEKIAWSHDGKEPSAPWPSNREIIYTLERSHRFSDTTLVIQAHFRDRRKNGEWSKLKPFSFSFDAIPELPDPVDRDIITRLNGVRRDTWYYGSYESAFRFQPRNQDLKILFPLISGTGRLYYRSSDSDGLRPVSYDDTETWEFCIEARRDTDDSRYEIRGAFHYSDRRLELSQPEVIFHEGVLLLENRIVTFRGSLEWIGLFRQEGSFFVPRGDADQWLETMLAMPSMPPMRLPDELRLQEIITQPEPIVRISTRKEQWGTRYIVGNVHFNYLGHEIEDHATAERIPLVSDRKIIVRDREREITARQEFETAGFRRKRDFHGREIWTISQSRLSATVRHLVKSGWHVETEGKLFRTPGPMNLHLSSGIDWFELHGAVEFGDTSIRIPQLLGALKRGETTIVLEDGSFGMLPEEWLQKYGLLAGLGSVEEDHVRFRRHQAGLLDALLGSQPGLSCDELFDHLRDELHGFKGVVPADEPEGFRGSLRGYQREGLGWFAFLQRFNLGGCLADDMGLGKTVQVLALLAQRRLLRVASSPGTAPPPSLVVMPRSLVFNWLQEAARFTPELRALEHTGGERIRGHEHFDDYDVVFTTYGTLRRDALFFKDKTFDYVILDEAQAIKNASTESAKAARLLKCRYRLVLSGTPIENHLGELWSLFEFLNPGMLGSASVLKLCKGPAGKLDDDNRALLAHALRPFILRRTKAQVAKELPEKVEQTLFCELDKPQRDQYNELRDHYRRSLLARIETDGIAKSRMHILEALLRLRQAAIHPGLIDKARTDESSAKLDVLLPHLLEVIDEGHKALVFSQFTSMLSIVRKNLEAENISYVYLDGQTRDRSIPVDHFQNDPDIKVFLISLKAGGTGLNLTAAEYVFLLDPWWNPAVEAQAIDRTHRIGQTKAVFAYRLIARNTVEEKVLELQKTKRAIAEAIISPDNSLPLQAEDLEILLS